MTDKINSRKLTDAELNKDLHKQIKALNITIGELKSELQESEARLKAEKPENSKLHTYKSQLKSTRIKHKKLQIAYDKIQHEMILSKSIKDKEVDAEEFLKKINNLCNGI